MPKSDYDLKAELDAAGVFETLDRIETKVDSMVNSSNLAFNKMKKSSEGSAVAFGAISGAVSAVTAELIRMGKRAVEAVKAVIAEAQNLNEEMETSLIIFTKMFGDEELASGFLDNLKESSAIMGVSFADAQRFAKAILPDTQNMEEFNELLRLAAVGAKDANLPIGQLVFSFNEMVAGDFKSIRDRLDIPKEIINKIKKAGSEVGITTAFIEEMNKLFTKRGINDLAAFADTAKATTERTAASFQNLKMAMGSPIFEEFKDKQISINEALKDNEDDLMLMAHAVGEIVANVMNLLNTKFVDYIEGIDPSKVFIMLDAFNDLANAGRLVAEVISGDVGDTGNKHISALTATAQALERAFISLAQLVGIFKAALAGASANLTNLVSLTDYFVGKLKGNDIVLTAEDFVDPNQAIINSLQETVDAFDAHEQRQGEYVSSMDAYKAALEEGADTSLDFSGSLLAQNQALARAEKALAEYEIALEAVETATNKINEQNLLAIEKIMLRAERAQIDAAISNARKREDIARKHGDKLRSISAKREEILKRAGEEDARDESDLEQERGKDKLDAAIKLADEIEDIEATHRRRLEDIGKTFDEAFADAIQDNDAVAAINARKRSERAKRDADTDRDRNLEDAQTGHKKTLAALKSDFQIEVKEMERARADRRKQLEKDLEKEIEAEQASYDKGLENQVRSEKRKQEDLAKRLIRSLIDQESGLGRKLQALDKGMTAELTIIEEYEQQKTDILEAGVEERTALRESELELALAAASALPIIPKGMSNNTPSPFPTHIPLVMKASGGPVTKNAAYVIGERGPEMFVPNQSGNIVPNHLLSNGGSTISNMSTSNEMTFNMIDPSKVNPAQVAQIKTLFLQWMGQVMK